ncbi:MerR family transcriptional regulator [Blastococcus sp. TML/M2B]|uniref:MerR family transcriptional regulator n=1 Tax=unclassified Blastococcus TaxID=2619396 RepID=UPI00190B0EBC|nr:MULTISPECIES: MerR family transcriptional regulator [unclassified Blastococcus]MBN1091868.1 MerR family transcriptional regulator [Blastococcus sp. TML/M2B]MBN1098025.1 MerR family transcriptional regulator [Blastococcus sp. TML/C7B]
MVTQVGSSPDGDDGELTVDQLAARAGVTVRNLRAYAARGLLPPPRMVGRTGYYGREHVARLLLVREMLAEGYTLAMIERTLSSAPPSGSSATLALHRALLAPWLPPEPEVTTGADLAARAGVPPSPAVVDSLVGLGLVERIDDERLRVLDPALLTAGIQVLALGVPIEALIDAQARVTEHVREIARTYVGMFVETRWQAWVEAGAPRDQVEEIRATVARLQPVAAQALLAAFRTEMAGTVQEAVETALSRLAEE